MADDEMVLREAEARSGISRRTLAYAASTGALDARRIGPMWVTTMEAIRAWLKESKHRPGPSPKRRPTKSL